MNWYILWLKIKCKLFKKHYWEDHIDFLMCRFCSKKMSHEGLPPRHINCRCSLCNTTIEDTWGSGEEETKAILDEVLRGEGNPK